MKNSVKFSDMVDRAMISMGHTHMRPVIEKELLHYDILFALDQDNLLDHLTFQGGTSLRLCYGAFRFSEDLDFAGGKEFVTADLMMMKNCLEQYLGGRYGLEISVKEPRELSQEYNEDDIRVDKWQISVITAPERKDLPRQKIKIEVVNIDAYSRQPLALQHNYEFLPDGYADILVMTETLDELMADKLISFVNCVRYIRYRDIWDLRWLKQNSAKINSNYILAKIQDYKITDYSDKLEHRLNALNEIIKSKYFYNEMSRFIATDVLDRTLKKEKFLDFLIVEIGTLLKTVEKIISPKNEWKI